MHGSSHDPVSHSADASPQEDGRGGRNYWPLVIVLALAALAAGAKQFAPVPRAAGAGEWMHDFMGFFLVTFSMFKLFDPRGFADGFQMYDLLAQPVRAYAYVYPWIELGLGLGYLARAPLPAVYVATVGVMGFGALGVVKALRQGLDVDCACMGSVLRVPLSTVALTEDLTMAAMAVVMWARHG